MSRSATASTPKNPSQLPSKSAWARGPPLQNSVTTTPHSHSPAPTLVSATNPASFHATHSRRPSALGQGVSIKDGVGIPRNATKQVTFGSIDDASAPISSSPAVKSAEGVRSFGSVAFQNGNSDAAKSAVTNRPTQLSSAPTSLYQAAAGPATTPPLPVSKSDKKSIAKLFQGPSTQSLSAPPPEAATSLPSRVPSQGQPYPPAFTPGTLRQSQNGNPSAPRSPVYSRPMANGQNSGIDVSGRPQAGSGSPSAGPAPTALSSPRLTPHPPPGSPGLPPPPAVGAGYYYHPSFVPPPEKFYKPPQWPGPLLPQHQTPPAHHPPGSPPPSAGLPMSPRNPPSPLQQVPGTSTQSHPIPPILHPPHTSAPHPSHSAASPPPGPSVADRSISPGASAGPFVPKKISIKNASGKVVNLEEIKRQIESPKEKENRLAEEQANDGDGEENKTSEATVKANEDAAHRLMEKKKRRKAKKETARIERERKGAEERAAREEREKECLLQEEERVQREAGENTERERAGQEILRKLQEEEQAQTTINTNIALPLPSALATARHIENINRITYPDGIKRPKVELNVNNQKGKFRYDRDFLLQFMNICKKKPDNLTPLDVIGLEPSDSSHTMPRGGSGRSRASNSMTVPARSASIGGSRDTAEAALPDGWSLVGTSTVRPQPKAGDLSQFGKINKAAPMTFGPSSIFAGKKGDPKNRDSSMSRIPSTSSNMFSMRQNSDASVEPPVSKGSRPSWKPSVDLGTGGPPDPAVEKRKLRLLPRTTPAVSEVGSDDRTSGGSDIPTMAVMSEEDAKAKIEEDVNEFFGIRALDEAESYFSSLPTEYRHCLVDILVTKAIEMKEPDVKLVRGLFVRVRLKGLCSPEVFEEGFNGLAEVLDDLAVDIPKAWSYFVMLLKGSGLDEDEERLARIAEKTMDPDKLDRLL